MFNRFEWKKIETRTRKDLIEKFPVQNLIGKRITQLNAIGYGCITPWDVTQPESSKLYCQIEVNEPFVFGFEDGSTFEIQFFGDDFCCFSENQLSAFNGEGINHQEVDANILFKEILNSRIKRIFFLEEIIFVMDNGYGLKMSNLSSNSGLIELEKNKKPVEKLGSEMMPQRKMKNPTEIDRDLLIRMHSMYRVKDAPYCPVVLYFPYFGNEELKKKWNALYHLLEHAYEKTIEKFPGCFDAVLVEKKGTPFKELVYLNPAKEQAVSFMYEMLKNLSIIDYEKEEYYDWSCYGKYFVTLSPEEINLFDNEKLNVYSSENAVLYEACKKADLEAIKAAVQSGANVNGFCRNFCGSARSTPIQVLLETVEVYDDGDNSIHHREAEIQNVILCIEYLLEQGADINLYAFGDDDVLENAFASRNEELINFMFEHGLIIQQNSNVLDFDDSYSVYDLYQQCWLMEHYWWRGYEYEDDYSDMEALMEQHGMSWYINNYTKEMVEEIEKQLVSFCQFNSL